MLRAADYFYIKHPWWGLESTQRVTTYLFTEYNKLPIRERMGYIVVNHRILRIKNKQTNNKHIKKILSGEYVVNSINCHEFNIHDTQCSKCNYKLTDHDKYHYCYDCRQNICTFCICDNKNCLHENTSK